jgi:Zn-dependent oligopeptidase
MTQAAATDLDFALLAPHGQPAFAAIRPEEIVPAVTSLIADHGAAMAAFTARAGDPAMLADKEEADRRFGEAWRTVGHLLAVTNTPNCAPPMRRRSRWLPRTLPLSDRTARSTRRSARSIRPRSIRWPPVRASWPA